MALVNVQSYIALMNLWRCGLLLFLVASTNLALHGQNPTETQSTSGLVVRIERIHDGEDACVLLNRSGDYRLERHFVRKTNVYVGTVAAAEVEEVRQWLDADQLKQLSQGDIRRDLNADTFDVFSLDIYRGDITQRLLFMEPKSRKRFRESLDPILDWLNQVKKQPHTEISEASANRCLPAPGEAAPVGWKPPVGNYVFFLTRDHAYSFHRELSCVLVYHDGKFRAEKTAGNPLMHLSTHAVEGQLEAAQVSDLQKLLDDPSLSVAAMQSHPVLASGGAYQDLDITRLAIPRPTSLQLLTFLGAVGRPGGHAGQLGGGPASSQHFEDPDRHIIDPLEQWIKQNIDNLKFSSVPDDKASECLPSN